MCFSQSASAGRRDDTTPTPPVGVQKKKRPPSLTSDLNFLSLCFSVLEAWREATDGFLRVPEIKEEVLRWSLADFISTDTRLTFSFH